MAYRILLEFRWERIELLGSSVTPARSRISHTPRMLSITVTDVVMCCVAHGMTTVIDSKRGNVAAQQRIYFRRNPLPGYGHRCRTTGNRMRLTTTTTIICFVEPDRGGNLVEINRRYVVFAGVIALLLTACTGGSQSIEVDTTPGTVSSTEAQSETPVDESSSVDSSATTTPAVTNPRDEPRETRATLTIDPQTGEPVGSEVVVPGPRTLIEIVDEGIERGSWDEVEGLTQVLGYAVGAVPADLIPGVTEVYTEELNELLERANALALSGEYSEDELAEIRRWYELAVPSDDAIEALAASATIHQAFGGDTGAREIASLPTDTTAHRAIGNDSVSAVQAAFLYQSQGNCAPVVAEEFSSYAVIEGCYELYEDSVEGVTVRVLYPAWYNEDENLAKLPLLTREALVKSVSTYKSFGEIGDMTVVFSLVATAESKRTPAVATHHAQWATASIPPGCPITVFPTGFEGDGRFQQVIAHEAWHCVQHYSGFPTGVASGTSWYHEAGAEYFSNVVYPAVNREHQSLPTFDSKSLYSPLFDLSYEAWIWWQYLANLESPRAVADLHLRMVEDSDGGVTAMSEYGSIFQRFTVEYIAGTIADASGAKLPAATQFRSPFASVTKNDVGKTMDFEVVPFVAGRFFIQYDPELRVFQSDVTSTDGEIAMVLWDEADDPDNWRGVYPEVRSKCENKTNYVLAVTTDRGTHTAKVRVDRIEVASCDPCMLGTWDLDLDTFEAMILDAAANGGEALPPGSSVEFRGKYFTSLNDQGLMQEQRDGLVMSMVSGEQSIDFTIDSYGEGKYTADGETLEMFDIVEFFTDVSASVPGLGNMAFPQGSSVSAGGSGMYECRTDDMTVTLDGFLPIRFDRVDKILSPPTTVAP